MANETYFDYDKEKDSLFIYRKEMVKGGVDVGNFIVDISHEGKIVGMEIMNVSEVLKNLGMENPQAGLENAAGQLFGCDSDKRAGLISCAVCVFGGDNTVNFKLRINYKSFLYNLN